MMRVDLRQWHLGQGDQAGLRVPVTHEQLQQGRFAAAGRALDAEDAVLWYVERDVAEDWLGGRLGGIRIASGSWSLARIAVAERDVVHGHAMVARQEIAPLLHCGGFVHQREQAAGGCKRLREIGRQRAQRERRTERAGQQHESGGQAGGGRGNDGLDGRSGSGSGGSDGHRRTGRDHRQQCRDGSEQYDQHRAEACEIAILGTQPGAAAPERARA